MLHVVEAPVDPRELLDGGAVDAAASSFNIARGLGQLLLILVRPCFDAGEQVFQRRNYGFYHS